MPKVKSTKTARAGQTRTARKRALNAQARKREIAREIKALGAKAEAAREKEDHEASRRYLERALSLDPEHGESIWWLADYWHVKNKPEPALKLYRKYLRMYPGDPEAVHMIASLGGRPQPKRASDDYLRIHFDSYAEDFDKSLLRELDYRAPKLLREALAPLRGKGKNKDAPLWEICDVGCGTGLVGLEVKPWAKRLVGVDLSRKMLAEARKRGIYDRLVASEIGKFLKGQKGRFDLIIAGDVLIYFGAVEPLFKAAARALKPGGLLAFSAEAGRGPEPYRLTDTGRYVHSPAALREAGKAAGLTERKGKRGRLRFESGKPVGGYISVMEKVGY